MDNSSGRKKRKKSKRYLKRLVSSGGVSPSDVLTHIRAKVIEEDDFLAFIDNILSEKPLKWFNNKPTSSHNDPLKTKMIFDSMIDRLRPTIITRTIAIADGLIYKMSAPYRHMKFWKSSRHAFKELFKANAFDIMEPLKSIAEKIRASNFEYDTNEQAVQYIAALLVARVERLCRACKLAALAASHCVAHIALGHLVASNILLLSVLSDVYKESLTQIIVLLDCYDSMNSLISDSKFPQSLRDLEAVKETVRRKSDIVGAPLSDMRRIVMDALSMNDVDLVNAFISNSEKKVGMKNENFGIPMERSFDDSMVGNSQKTAVIDVESVSEEKGSNEINAKREKKKKKFKDLSGEIQTSKKRKLIEMDDVLENEVHISSKKKKNKKKLKAKVKEMVSEPNSGQILEGREKLKPMIKDMVGDLGTNQTIKKKRKLKRPAGRILQRTDESEETPSILLKRKRIKKKKKIPVEI